MSQKEINLFKKSLKITKIISIRFSDEFEGNYKKFEDTACSALARSLKYDQKVLIDRSAGQLCSGGNYFLGIKKFTEREIEETYVEKEGVFKKAETCRSFLETIPRYPETLNKRYILFAPLDKENGKPEVIIMLANPAQASRLLGLSVHKKYSIPEVIPAGPTCISLFSALVSQRIHLNFIDYFDRYYQGKVDGKLMWEDNELLVSCSFDRFGEILAAVSKSAHGSFIPDIKPVEITPLS